MAKQVKNEKFAGGGVATIKVSAITVPVDNELAIWLPGKDGRNHIVKLYNGGDGKITAKTILCDIDVQAE